MSTIGSEQRLQDTDANAVWQRAVAWLARRMWKSRTYWLVADLCQQLTRLDYKLAHDGLGPHEYRYTIRYVTKPPTTHAIEALYEALASYPQQLKTAAILTQAALRYYEAQGNPLKVPHAAAVQPNVIHRFHRTLDEQAYEPKRRTTEEETFTPNEVKAAVRDFLEFGEQQFDKGHLGYYSGSGWAARCLRWHLRKIS